MTAEGKQMIAWYLAKQAAGTPVTEVETRIAQECLVRLADLRRERKRARALALRSGWTPAHRARWAVKHVPAAVPRAFSMVD